MHCAVHIEIHMNNVFTHSYIKFVVNQNHTKSCIVLVKLN